jgi:hypothetical protein
MDELHDRIRVLEEQVGHYRIINRMVNIGVGMVLFGCAAFVVSNLLSLKRHVEMSASAFPGWGRNATVQVRRLEVVDAASTRPVCVLGADGGGGRIEVFDFRGRPLAGFDGNRGLVVRSADGVSFPETRPR